MCHLGYRLNVLYRFVKRLATGIPPSVSLAPPVLKPNGEPCAQEPANDS
jgi:hypothetical protein